MRTIIAGSRTLGLPEVRIAMRECGWVPTVVLSGCANGADTAGETWAAEHGIPVERFPAEWAKHGRAAGIYRNLRMAEEGKAEALVAVWDGHSPGTAHMHGIALQMGLRIYLWTPPKDVNRSVNRGTKVRPRRSNSTP